MTEHTGPMISFEEAFLAESQLHMTGTTYVKHTVHGLAIVSKVTHDSTSGREFGVVPKGLDPFVVGVYDFDNLPPMWIRNLFTIYENTHHDSEMRFFVRITKGEFDIITKEQYDAFPQPSIEDLLQAVPKGLPSITRQNNNWFRFLN
jgi:hypothetical protein